MYFKNFTLIILCLLLGGNISYSQNGYVKKWSSPLDSNAVRGRLSEFSESNFHRLPEAMKDSLREPVWNLSKHSAGLYIDFKSAAESISVRYGVSGSLNMPHMPTTGVSGLDLYAFDTDRKEWNWAHGSYHFSDTITYNFSDLSAKGENLNYRLYLPLYNEVTWLEIATSDGVEVHYITPKPTNKAILVYGTSIAQGACASRPGLAWTNILGRLTNSPVINLGFSGNGRLEPVLIERILNQDALAIVLDCLPNLGVSKNLPADKLKELIINAVKQIRAANSQVPIIFTEHSAGFNPQVLNRNSHKVAEETTLIAREAIKELMNAGVEHIYTLQNSAIDLSINSTVDYVHPNDLGMEKIAEAYHELIKSRHIL